MKTLKMSLVAAVLATSGAAMAGGFTNAGEAGRTGYDPRLEQAISIKPIYNITSKTVCNQAAQNGSGGGFGGYVAPAVGGAAGGLLGAQVGKGNGKVAMGVIGAVIGTMTGQALGADNGSQGQSQQQCEVRTVQEFGGSIVTTDTGRTVFIPANLQSQ